MPVFANSTNLESGDRDFNPTAMSHRWGARWPLVISSSTMAHITHLLEMWNIVENRGRKNEFGVRTPKIFDILGSVASHRVSYETRSSSLS